MFSIVPESIIEKLQEAIIFYNKSICKSVESYISKNEYNAKTVCMLIKWIDVTYNEMQGNWLYSNNPFLGSRNLLVNDRYLILNEMLQKEYNKEILIELYETNQLNMQKYIKCIDNTLFNKSISFKNLLIEIKSISIKDNCNDIVLPIINSFLNNYHNEKTIDFNEICGLILDATHNNLDIVIRFLWQHLNIGENLIYVSGHWIDSMLGKIKKNDKNIQYIYYNVNIQIKHKMNAIVNVPQINYEQYSKRIDSMTEIYLSLCNYLQKKTLNNMNHIQGTEVFIDKKNDSDVHENANDNKIINVSEKLSHVKKDNIVLKDNTQVQSVNNSILINIKTDSSDDENDFNVESIIMGTSSPLQNVLHSST